MKEEITYPYYEVNNTGWRVHLNERVKIPGHFTSLLQAEKAYRKSIIKAQEAVKKDSRKKKQKEDK